VGPKALGGVPLLSAVLNTIDSRHNTGLAERIQAAGFFFVFFLPGQWQIVLCVNRQSELL